MKIWNSPAGAIKLERYPFAGQKSHQAWDAADEWIVKRFPVPDTSLYIVGEAFGVLGTAWSGSGIIALSDSHLSLSALEENRRLNPDKAVGTLKKCPITEASPAGAADDIADDETPTPCRIIIRLPKAIDLLESYIRAALILAGTDTEIWIGGMDKRWNRGVQKITEKLLETVKVFPFERHARWIQFKPRPENTELPQSNQAAEWELERYPISILPAPAVFSAAGLDGGTAAFIEAFPETQAEAADISVDLGCGSGILGLCAAYLNPEGRVIFTDESYLAVKNAETNFKLNGFSAEADFIVSNGAEGLDDNSVDLVLCNPPFHYQNIQTREPAEFLFNEAKRILKAGGTIQVVGNSHLGYHKLLKEYFPNARDVYRSDKFTVMRGRK